MKRQFFFSEIERSVWEVVLVWKVTKTKTRWATHRPRWSEFRARSSGNTACFVWLSVFFLYIYIIWGTDYELVGGLSFAPHSSADCIPIGTLHRAEPSVGGYCLECVCEHYRGLTYRPIEFTFLIHPQIMTSIHASNAHQPDGQTDKLQNTCHTTALIRQWPDTFTTAAQLYINNAV